MDFPKTLDFLTLRFELFSSSIVCTLLGFMLVSVVLRMADFVFPNLKAVFFLDLFLCTSGNSLTATIVASKIITIRDQQYAEQYS